MKRRGEKGVVLVNVLVILALSSAVIYVMLGSRESGIARVADMTEATAAELLALGAEASVVAALRRDLETGPDADHFAEPWAGIAQEETLLATGRFSVEIRDVQRKYDINHLAGGGLAPVEVLARLLTAVDQPPELAPRIASVLSRTGPVRSLEDLAAFGLPGPALAALTAYVTALPVEGTVNLNTADPVLLAAMLNNRALAARIVALRAREGQITRDTLAGTGAIRPDHSGFTSNLFDIRVLAEAGGARVVLESRILRSADPARPTVGVLSRRFAAPDDAPPQT